MVQNMINVDGRTKFKVVSSVGSTWVRGTPNIHTITTLYIQKPMYLESFKAEKVKYNKKLTASKAFSISPAKLSEFNA